jgi:hypothetical protein
MDAYHFVGDTLRDGRDIPGDGEVLVHEDVIKLCASGLHASLGTLLGTLLGSLPGTLPGTLLGTLPGTLLGTLKELNLKKLLTLLWVWS